MNLILFDPGELDRPLPHDDPRAVHILTVLRRKIGGEVDVGIINGQRGRATLTAIAKEGLRLHAVWSAEAQPLAPLGLIVGLSRPQTMRRVLRDCTTLGAKELLFTATEKTESSYAESSLWREGEYRRYLLEGAAQAFATRLPSVRLFESLAECLAAIPPGGTRVALDNYEAPTALSDSARSVEKAGAGNEAETLPVILAVGGERGWSGEERDLLRARGFALAHLGSRVQRTENACLIGASLLLAALGALR